MSNAPFTLLGIDHVVIRAADARRLVDFYVSALGCTMQWERPELGLYHLTAGSALLDIVSIDGPLGVSGVAAPSGTGRNVDHVCFQVDAIEPEALGKHLRELGLEMDEPKTRFGAQGFGVSVYLQDPEGNGIELKVAAAAPANR
ncbi:MULTISPECIES: VOC family protein [Novosphingobium]|uniref:Glyoxalase/bleomycin resistance protein/dioxygenase n=1 Tax=Novosphingobium subterraneum TaxID=48936 RepID=A0A0B8Z7P4_9SPHN|nr:MULTISPECIES: VOC family protein [Novosphingobium]KHS42280.1 glyoxalase/bleomycin resistance protein/dioxygenase [Novosphingobium subterraneum]QOV94382.1 VOC family protein [Novosphingobium sp. ES2-1]